MDTSRNTLGVVSVPIGEKKNGHEVCGYNQIMDTVMLCENRLK